MERRGFLRAMLAAAAAPAYVRAEILMPVRKIIVPELLLPQFVVTSVTAGSPTIITSAAITNEALRILHQNMDFMRNLNRDYAPSWGSVKPGDVITIGAPKRYVRQKTC